jgi:hypothetical protein
MEVLKELFELNMVSKELNIDGELPNITHLDTKYLYCNFNKSLKLSHLPQTLELISCNNKCRIINEGIDVSVILPNVKGFIDAYGTIVDSWEYLFRICPNLETLDMRRLYIPQEVCLLKNLKIVCIDGGEECAHLGLEVPENCEIIVSALGYRPKKYIYRNGEPHLKNTPSVTFDDFA